MQLDKLLQSQGFGSRKHCQNLITQGSLSINGEIIRDCKLNLIPDDLEFVVANKPYRYRQQVYLALNKPRGLECSQQPQHHRSIFELFDPILRARGIQTVGRLDQDTTGLLLLSDDGQFVHRLTHPRRHIAKYYMVTTADCIDAEQVAALAHGVNLHQEQGIFKALHITQCSENSLRFAIEQGVYHQVKRMLAAVGHRVIGLERDQIGQLGLASLQLAQGESCYLNQDQLALLV